MIILQKPPISELMIKTVDLDKNQKILINIIRVRINAMSVFVAPNKGSQIKLGNTLSNQRIDLLISDDKVIITREFIVLQKYVETKQGFPIWGSHTKIKYKDKIKIVVRNRISTK